MDLEKIGITKEEARDSWSDDKILHVKLECNRLVWENADGDITLNEAETIACEMLALIMQGPQRLNKQSS